MILFDLTERNQSRSFTRMIDFPLIIYSQVGFVLDKCSGNVNFGVTREIAEGGISELLLGHADISFDFGPEELVRKGFVFVVGSRSGRDGRFDTKGVANGAGPSPDFSDVEALAVELASFGAHHLENDNLVKHVSN